MEIFTQASCPDSIFCSLGSSFFHEYLTFVMLCHQYTSSCFPGCLCTMTQQIKSRFDLTDSGRFKSGPPIWQFESSTLRGKHHGWNHWICFLKVDWLHSDASHTAQKQFGWLRHLLNPRLGLTRLRILSVAFDSTEQIGLKNTKDFCWVVACCLQACFDKGARLN